MTIPHCWFSLESSQASVRRVKSHSGDAKARQRDLFGRGRGEGAGGAITKDL